MEENVYEAFKNNVIGTRNVLRAAHFHNCERFVLVSTDKAVDPTSMMGASKRLAEMVIQSYATKVKSPQFQPVSTAIVRFGNVIGSAGSVIPLFKEQIIGGGPLTVTHPEMERFFMSIREAVRLILTAGILGEDGEVYVLDMGQPIKILDVAKKMLHMYGRPNTPIIFTGIRAGEKLKETIVSSHEKRSPTMFTKIEKIDSPYTNSTDISAFISEMEASVEQIPDLELSRLIMQLASRSHSFQDAIRASMEE